jgi:hypothetical protein
VKQRLVASVAAQAIELRIELQQQKQLIARTRRVFERAEREAGFAESQQNQSALSRLLRGSGAPENGLWRANRRRDTP